MSSNLRGSRKPSTRLIVIREDMRVRLLTRGGHDWSGRFPWIVDSALKHRQRHFVIDGEAVVLGVDGIPDFNALHSHRHDHPPMRHRHAHTPDMHHTHQH